MNTPIKYLTASWCAPCKALKPKVVKECEALGLPLEIIDVDVHAAQAEALGVQGVPSIVIGNGPALKASDMPWARLRDMLRAEAL